MGFPTLDIDKSKNKIYGNLFKCVEEPSATTLIQQLQILVSLAKKTLGVAATASRRATFSRSIVDAFSKIFDYLSGRISEIDASILSEEEFIPCLVNNEVR